MGAISLNRGDDAIGFSNKLDEVSTLPPFAIDPATVIASLIDKISDLEIIVEGKVTKGELKTEIAFGSELIKIQADEVAIVGAFTVIDLVNEQNGTTSGTIDPTITRIVGDLIQTGAIISNNFSPSAGTAIDLDNATIIMGGTADPKFNFDGVNLFIKGTIQAGSIIAVGISSDDLSDSISDPTSGVVIDGDGLRGFAAGVQTFEIPTDGSVITFGGTVQTDNEVIANGVSIAGSFIASIIGQPTDTFRNGVAGISVSGTGVFGISVSGIGVVGQSGTGTAANFASTSGIAVELNSIFGGSAINLVSDIITGDATFEDVVVMEETLSVTGIGITASILGEPTDTSKNGVAGITLSGVGVSGTASTGIGVFGLVTGAGDGGSFVSQGLTGTALAVEHILGGSAINLVSDIITGDATFEDDVVIEETLNVTGSGITASILGEPTDTSKNGVAGITLSGVGVLAQSSTGIAVSGLCTGAGIAGTFVSLGLTGIALRVQHVLGGPAINLLSDVITGDATFEDDVSIDLTLTVTQSATFNKSTDAVKVPNGNVLMGSPTNSGAKGLLMSAGTASGTNTSRVFIYADNISGGNTGLGIVSGEAPQSNGSFNQTHRMKITINGTEYFWALDTV